MSFHLPHEMFQNQTALLADFQDFEQKIQALAEAIHLDLTKYEIDHLSLRVNSEQKAREWLALLLNYGSVLSDNSVNKHYAQETWEHIEVVVPFLTGETEAEWLARIKNLFLRNQSEGLKVKTSEPKADGEKLVNLSVAISFSDQNHNHTCIKVHPYSIKQIIEAV